jgi:predicted MFS family arabinose efflux permease
VHGRLWRRVGRRVASWVGGPARLRVVAVLAAVLAMNSADTGTLGAVAVQLEGDLHISHAQLGLLASVSAAVGAAACLPVGVLADRVNRVRLLATTIVVWSGAMAASGLATSYLWLLVSRVALGAAVAAAGPVVASLIGDLFTPTDRARAYGWVLSGEVLGSGVGLLVGGEISAALSWRYAFLLLAAASLVLSVVLLRGLPEPARGGESWVPAGARGIPMPDNDHDPARDDEDESESASVKVLASATVRPVRERVRPVADLSLWQSLRYLLGIPTIRLLIIASSVGYFFFAGLRTFAVIFVEQWYHQDQSAVSGLILVIGVGALAGVLLGGRLTDRVLSRGVLTARVAFPAVAYSGAAILFVPGLFSQAVLVALPLYVAAAAALSAANPPLDAARLDVVPAGMWGRAESLRTVLRFMAEAVAPATFGLVADGLGHGRTGTGLRDAFLVMLLPLLGNGILVWLARHSYPGDVATASACDRLGKRRRGR